MNKHNRRDFLKLGAASSLSAALVKDSLAESLRGGIKDETMMEFKAPPMNAVRVGYVGVGLQGTSHVENLLKIEGAEIRAVCDIIAERVERRQNIIDQGRLCEARRLLARPDRLQAAVRDGY